MFSRKNASQSALIRSDPYQSKCELHLRQVNRSSSVRLGATVKIEKQASSRLGIIWIASRRVESTLTH